MKFAARLALVCSLVGAFSLFAAPNEEPYPAPASKKGLQVQMVDDALALGIHHAGLSQRPCERCLHVEGTKPVHEILEET